MYFLDNSLIILVRAFVLKGLSPPPTILDFALVKLLEIGLPVSMMQTLALLMQVAPQLLPLVQRFLPPP